MNEAETQGLSVLLPASSITVFSKDTETLEAAKRVSEDWRFARVKVKIEEGDAAAAIEMYSQYESPDLIIVQTETIESAFTEQLGELSGHCAENTAAIVIGPVNDVNLYRDLIDIGVSDYLVKPLDDKVLGNVIAKTLIERLGVTGSRLIAFAGAKGGVGTTVLAEAAAWTSSDLLDQKTILLDAAGGWSSLSVGMGFEPSTTLQEAAKAALNADEDSLSRMIYKCSGKLSVLASGGEALFDKTLTGEQVEALIDMLMARYPVLIADLSHSSPELEKVVLTRANQIVIVTTPILSALRQARALIQEVREIRGGEDKHISLIVNMQGLDTGNEVPKNDIEQAIEHPVSGLIPLDTKTFIKVENESRKLTEDKVGQEIVKNTLLPLLARALSLDVDMSEKPEETRAGFFDRLFKSGS